MFFNKNTTGNDARLQNGEPGADPLPLADLQTARDATNWVDFGGIPVGNDGGSPGLIENPPHNFMHSMYVSGFMQSTTSAAHDPIFWLFHCGIDFFWWDWQQTHSDAQPADPTHVLQGFNNPPITSIAVWDASQLGYTYAQKTLLHPGLVARVASERMTPIKELSFDVTIPKPGFKRAKLLISGEKTEGASPHVVYYYLYPPNVKLSVDDPQFREKYYAGMDAVFGGASVAGAAHAHHPPNSKIRVDVTKALGRAAEKSAGEKWKITAVYRGAYDRESGKARPCLLGQDVNQGPIYLVLDGK